MSVWKYTSGPLPKVSPSTTCRVRRLLTKIPLPLQALNQVCHPQMVQKKNWECQLVPVHFPLAKWTQCGESFILRAVRRTLQLGSKEDVRVVSYYLLQLCLCLRLWIKTYPWSLQRITDKFHLCYALIFSDKCFFLYQAYAALDFKTHW